VGSFFQRLERWEKRLQLLLIVLFSLMVIFQVVMTREPFRFYLSFAERMEGVPWPQDSSMVTKFAGQAVGRGKDRTLQLHYPHESCCLYQ